MKARRYSMQSRAAAADATRLRILETAQQLFFERWYDAVTLALVAQKGGVSAQTVLNHFGDKEGLFDAVVNHASSELQDRREQARPEDIDGAIAILVDDYEITGDATIRLLATEEHVPAVRRAMDMGRRNHREWVERIFGAAAPTPELLAVTDVYVWKLLRRDQDLGREATVDAMRRMVHAVLSSPSPTHDTPRRHR